MAMSFSCGFCDPEGRQLPQLVTSSRQCGFDPLDLKRAFSTILLIVGLASMEAVAQPAAPSSSEPTSYKLMRYEEDYRYLRDPARRTDFWDPIKYIPIGSDPGTYLSFGGELRERFEYYSAPDFGVLGQQADAYLLHRLLLHADLHVGESFRAFVQFGNHLAPDKDNVSGTYEDRLDLQQGFLDVRLPVAPQADIDPTARVGRQEMVFGSQRLVAVRDAPNVRRAFDGIRIGDKVGGVRVDGFLTRPVLLETGVFDDERNRDQALWGVYGTVPATFVPGLGIDLYYLGFENDRARFGTVSGGEHRHSIGTRLFGAAAGWDWDWEALAQFGTFADQDIRAWTVSTNTGYTFRNARWGPRVGLKADIASGDDDPRDGTLGTFNALFPKLAYFNSAALLAPANVFDVQPTLSVKPVRDVLVSLGWDFLWRVTTNDAVYIAPFTPVAGTAGRGGRFIGNQVALDVAWQINRNVYIDASYVHFDVGDALRTGGARDIDFVMLQIGYRF
jgi:Alginate export